MSDSPDDDTIRVRRSWPGRPPHADAQEDDDLDEVTAVSRRRGESRAPDPDPAESDGAAPIESDDAEPVRHRATYIDGIDPADQTDGSTIVARRESRRRATREIEGQDAYAGDAGTDADAAARSAEASEDTDALSPTDDGALVAATNVVYPIREPGHIIAEHLNRDASAPQAPVDGNAAATQRRRGARRATVIVVATASVVAISAAAALIAIVLSL